VGLIGVLVQGWLIRPLSKRYDSRGLMVVGITMAAIGLGWIPYITTETQAVGVFVIVLISTGHGLFGPTQSTLLALAAEVDGIELGRAMGAQEGFGALSRIIGPVFAAFIWAETVDGTGLWTYHTVFRVAGLIAIISVLIQLGIKKPNTDSEAMNDG
jgi:MFS family permease